MAFDVVRVGPEAVAPFYLAHRREALKTFYAFSVVWHEQSYDFVALDGERILGAATLRVAASLGHVDRIVVIPESRRAGIGRSLLANVAEVANYYNCHKMTTLVPHLGEAERFFEACDYRTEAILPQHTFKLDMASMRKFLL